MILSVVKQQLVIEAETLHDAYELGRGAESLRRNKMQYTADAGQLSSRPIVQVPLAAEEERQLLGDYLELREAVSAMSDEEAEAWLQQIRDRRGRTGEKE